MGRSSFTVNRTAWVTVFLGSGSSLVDQEANIKATTDVNFLALRGMLLPVLFVGLDLPLLVTMQKVELALVSVENAFLQSK